MRQDIANSTTYSQHATSQKQRAGKNKKAHFAQNVVTRTSKVEVDRLSGITPRQGIFRVVHHVSGTLGWCATICRASGCVRRTFSDSVYGGPEGAYRSANSWYEEMLPQFPTVSRTQKMKTIRRNNRSGVTGVYRWPAQGTDHPEAYWAAQWVVNPYDKPLRRKFTVARYGEQRAKKLAIEARHQALEDIQSSAGAAESSR